MPRPPNIVRPIRLKTYLPEDIRTRLDLHLWSETEQRVPHGSYQRLITRLVTEYLDRVEGKANEPIT